jgi:Ca-activated chloride channel family protein
LAPLPKSEGKEKLIPRYHEQFHWPLAVAILLLLAEMFLPERKRGTKITGAISKIGAAKIATLVVAFCVLPNPIFASPSSALREYNAGQFDDSLKEYQRLAQVDTNELRLVFDAGASAYQATNFDEALKDFKIVTRVPDLKLQQQTYYNLGNTQYRLGELKFEPDSDGLNAMKETWMNAVQSYAHAVQLNTNDVDAAYNLAFVKRQIELIDQLREAMLRAKQSADEAVRRNEFHRALEIMESLNSPIAAKKFQDYIKKLKDIDAIVTPHQP